VHHDRQFRDSDLDGRIYGGNSFRRPALPDVAPPQQGHRFRAHESATGQGAVILFIVLGLVAVHTVEIWLYACAYLAVGALPDFESALYFSTASFTTLGYGDVVLDKAWRLVGAIEGANGLLLFGWSTAFLISLTSRMRTLEHDWLERQPPAAR